MSRYRRNSEGQKQKVRSQKETQTQFLLTAIWLDLLGIEIGTQALALAESSYRGLAVAIATKATSILLFLFLARNVLASSNYQARSLLGWRMICAYILIIGASLLFARQLLLWQLK